MTFDYDICGHFTKSRINVMEMRSPCNMCGVHFKDRCRNNEVREWYGLKKELITTVEKAVKEGTIMECSKFQHELFCKIALMCVFGLSLCRSGSQTATRSWPRRGDCAPHPPLPLRVRLTPFPRTPETPLLLTTE
ncbi:hypothetical protein EVAR_21187_1 [Eumeta japonica]|uniref:Uncharacterized protein n=1 Tax=Eumeta variegata TaxID=151549 RepID=A0A4C1UPT6_EUMVA|nr:hypothetical protein EVAR_21187_1 [Eumeta japonica]